MIGEYSLLVTPSGNTLRYQRKRQDFSKYITHTITQEEFLTYKAFMIQYLAKLYYANSNFSFIIVDANPGIPVDCYNSGLEIKIPQISMSDLQ